MNKAPGSEPFRRSAADRARRVAQILGEAGKEDASQFAAASLGAIPPDDLAQYDEATLAGAVASLWAFADQRREDEVKVRVFNPERDRDGYLSANTVIEAINADKPFLLDSMLATIHAHGVAVKALWHPIVPVARDENGRRAPGGQAFKESLIHIEVTRISEDDARVALEHELRAVFADVALAVRDWRAMRDRLDQAAHQLGEVPPDITPSELNETLAFLAWLRDDQFTFLGCRDYELKVEGDGKMLEPMPATGLGILTDPARRIVRRDDTPHAMSPSLKAYVMAPTPLIVAKANTRSNVHRRVHMDYIGVKRFSPDGKVIGERRFVGLFTSAAYHRSAREIPYLRGKVARAVERAGFDPGSHDGKAYIAILDDFPRDDLFQIDDDELFDLSIGILRLYERPRTQVFVRWDKFDRFVSVLAYVPRERYRTDTRLRIADILCKAFDGHLSAFAPSLTHDTLARIQFIIGRNQSTRPEVDLDELENKIAHSIRDWEDDLLDVVSSRHGEERGLDIFQRLQGAFNAGYRETFTAEEALDDYTFIEALDGELGVRLYRMVQDGPEMVHAKIYHAGERVVLSDVLPVLEHLGLKVIAEQSYPVTLSPTRTFVLHDFLMCDPQAGWVDIARIKKPFEDAFMAVWRGEAESDGFNRLVALAALPWRDVTVLRAISRFLRQAAIPYSLNYMEDALAKHAVIAAALVELFHTRFAPDVLHREKTEEALVSDIKRALEDVSSLDEDRIVRRFLNVVMSTLRTNHYQREYGGALKPTLAFKLDSRALEELPAPRPMMEIFVYSPRLEGVHLRFGKVARGGLRWSDRREDFRTEILGLVKAQRVKNAVIVPVGAKGGFVLKGLPSDAPRDAVQAEGVACYKIFVSTLLDLTDNKTQDGIDPPRDVVRKDGDDPYLVVAADKGTASFSDIANAIALERGFWLGDAFASGGSNGYDHKKMGITARGAWEAVKRHFREIGVNVQETPFRVAGVGDMSGDVFGNAMLLSRKIKLVMAFDHRDIFIDPNPDPETSWHERKRMFELPRSSWADYDKSLISKGGGVFSRTLKSVPLTNEIRALTGLRGESAPPTDLLRAILRADVDLLWFGGIGTYVKASSESNGEVGDRSNDAIRADGKELRAKVVGEGANLGVTQRGRIEFARAGGHINTDAVDNSAGVDTSDHEVNIKILIDAEIRAGKFPERERLPLLRQMTDDVAHLVLKNNYHQTLALTLSEATAAPDIARQARFIDTLERQNLLDRAVERLPDREALRELEEKKQGLTRPELAVLIAYAKMTLFEELLESAMPDDPHYLTFLTDYFPVALRTKLGASIGDHPLHREIIATEVANLIVNMAGPTFSFLVSDETGRSLEDVARAFSIARAVFDVGALYDAINALDNKVDAALQSTLHLEAKQLLRRQTLWFLRNGPEHLPVEETVARFAPGVGELFMGANEVLSPYQRERSAARAAEFAAGGVGEALARAIALLDSLTSASAIVAMAEETERPVEEAARCFFTLGEAMALDRLADTAEEMKTDNIWDTLARVRLVNEIQFHQRAVAKAALLASPESSGEAAALDWVGHNEHGAERLAQMITDFDIGGLTIAKLAVAEGALRSLVTG